MNTVLTNLARDRAYIERLRKAGVEAAQAKQDAPAATLGIFAGAIAPWAAGKTYVDAGSLFTYENKVGFTRQANVTAMAHQPPFSTGMESVYGVRPIPDLHGNYPYVYNMAAAEGMHVADEGAVYLCTRALDPVLYAPSALPGHFERVIV